MGFAMPAKPRQIARLIAYQPAMQFANQKTTVFLTANLRQLILRRVSLRQDNAMLAISRPVLLLTVLIVVVLPACLLAA
jgi:hypothetical protein